MRGAPQISKGGRKAGFTLLELMVSIGIIGIAIAILLPAFQKMRERSNDQKCIANIRACGNALLLHAGDNRLELALPWGGDDATASSPAFQERYPNLASSPQFKKNWCDYLMGQGIIENQQSFYCPSHIPRSTFSDPNRVPWGFAYGMRRYAAVSTQYQPMALATLERRQSFVLLGDSIRPGTQQWYYTHHPAGASGNQFHFRHSGKATFFFLDGSVKMLLPQDLINLGDGWLEGVVNTTPPVLK